MSARKPVKVPKGRLSKAEWDAVVTRLLRRDSDLFVDYVILGMHRGFISENRAVQLLTMTVRETP
jgi:hypothetical protein